MLIFGKDISGIVTGMVTMIDMGTLGANQPDTVLAVHFDWPVVLGAVVWLWHRRLVWVWLSVWHCGSRLGVWLAGNRVQQASGRMIQLHQSIDEKCGAEGSGRAIVGECGGLTTGGAVYFIISIH